MDSDSKRSFANYGNTASYDSDQRIGLPGNPLDPIGRRSRPFSFLHKTVELATENERLLECETTALTFSGNNLDAIPSVSNSTPAYLALQPVKHPTLQPAKVGKPVRKDTSPVRTDESIRAYYDLLDHTINMPGWSEYHAETANAIDDLKTDLEQRRLNSVNYLMNAHPQVRFTQNSHRITQGTSIVNDKQPVHASTTSPVPSPLGAIHIRETGEISVPVNVRLRLRNAVRAAPSKTTEIFCRLLAEHQWLEQFWPENDADEIREHLQDWFRRRNLKYVSVTRILPTLERCSPFLWSVKLSVHRTEIPSCPRPINTVGEHVV
jgi:hypothetical protein